MATPDPYATGVVVVADTCGACGSTLPVGADFCAACGAPQTRTVRQPIAADDAPFFPVAPLTPDGPRSRSRVPVTTLALAIMAVAVVGLLIATVVLHSGGSRRAGTSPSSDTTAPAALSGTTTVSTTPPVPTTSSSMQTQLAAINSLLDQSATARQAVLLETKTLTTCTDATAMETAIQTLSSAASTRQDLLNLLDNLPVDQIPDGTQLVSTLDSAWQVSIQSDQSYAAWGSDEESGTCGKDDSNFQAAQGTDTQATSDKTAFVAEWNPLAAQYGFPQRNQSSI